MIHLTNPLHIQAMEHADHGLFAQRQGRFDDALPFFQEALRLEIKAIETLEDKEEPVWSVLHRSAAALALDCNEQRKAEQLASRALGGNPPEAIAEELRIVLERAQFERHLATEGIELNDDEIQLAISGQSVGYGFVRYNEFVGRISYCKKLLQRIAERLNGISFRTHGPPQKSIVDNYPVYLSPSRAGSFATTIKVAQPARQRPFEDLEDVVDPAVVVGEFMELMDLFRRAQFDQIHEAIQDGHYRDNFVALARIIAPDGKRVSQIGFTSKVKGETREVPVRLTKTEAKKRYPGAPQMTVEGALTTVIGELKFADDLNPLQPRIRLVDEDNNEHTVAVKPGLLADIVRPLFGETVKVVGMQHGNVIQLDEVEEWSENEVVTS